MQLDPNSLLQQANCYSAYASNLYQLALMNLALLRQIVLQGNPMSQVDPQSLLTQAQCFECYAGNPFQLQLMSLALLAQLVTAGGGSAAAQSVFCGAGAPSVTPTAAVAIWIQTDSLPPNQITGVWYSGAWH